MKKKFLIPVLFLWITAAAVFPGDNRNAVLYTGYFGEMAVHPGGVLGGGIEVLHRDRYSMWGETSVFTYIHPENHFGLGCRADWAHRLTGRKGFFGEAGLGLGYFHTWSDGEVYTRRDDGGAAVGKNTGWPHLYTGLFIGTGWNFKKPAGAPVTPYLRAHCFFEYPFNGFLLPHLAAEMGLRVRIKR